MSAYFTRSWRNPGAVYRRQNAPGFTRLALWRLDAYTLGEASGPSRISGAIATAEIFELLGVQPLLGRFFSADNQVPAADKVVEARKQTKAPA